MSGDPYRDLVKRGNLRPEYARRQRCSVGDYLARAILDVGIAFIIAALIIEAITLLARALT